MAGMPNPPAILAVVSPPNSSVVVKGLPVAGLIAPGGSVGSAVISLKVFIIAPSFSSRVKTSPPPASADEARLVTPRRIIATINSAFFTQGMGEHERFALPNPQ